MSETNVPRNLDEAMVALETMLQASPETMARFMAITSNSNATAQLHFSLGRRIRNDWGLWSGGPLADYFNSIGIEHPDDMSGIILTSTWRKLHGRDINVEEQVAFYRDYWKKIKVITT